jgi:D-alanyl-D-alanine carboxypeptidase/D-alanyl-D-alanine-endopeptidase (penicillin-binding protein 4)
MAYIFFAVCFFLPFLLPPNAHAVDEKLVARLKADIAGSKIKSSEIGVWVGSEADTFFAHDADSAMIPASLSKLVTLGSVLHELRPGFKFKTTLVSDSKISDGRVQGDLYLKGAGDPSFVSENMWFLVNELTRTGVTKVEGDIIVDDSRFDQVRWGDDRQEERVDRAYDAPVGAMSMNWNSVSVYVRPGDKAGEKAQVFADVMSPYIRVKNESKTVASGRGITITVERAGEKDFVGDVIVVSGAIALGHPEKVFYKNITQPDLWAGNNLVEFLKQRGISVKGGVRIGRAPAKGAVLATSESKPLSLIAADMAKWSNNYVAEMLVKNMAAEAGGQGSMVAGMVQVRKYLEHAGLKQGSFEFVNAAGLTRKNRLSARQIGLVLEHVRKDFSIFPEFLSALPIAGVDGTLRNRMKQSPGENWVRAKTGLLNGVVGLAGFSSSLSTSLSWLPLGSLAGTVARMRSAASMPRLQIPCT